MKGMKLYLNELAPWERKKEYYSNIQLGKDVKEQTQIVNQQTKAMIASQIASTSAVIASQDRISEGIDSLSLGVEHVEQGIYELKSAFEWGISEVVWQIEQNREMLKDILEVLMAPLDTQAKERRKRAEEAYANNWIDDAVEEFLESERLNKFDFSIHISLGMIYLFRKIDKNKALSYFEKAIKYAKPKSPYYSSYALLHKALIRFDFGEVDDAEKCTSDAIALSPDFAEAFYQNAQYNAQLNEEMKSIQNLKEAIKLDKYYCIKAHKDPLFDPIREKVNQLFEKLREEEKQNAVNSFNNISNEYKKLYPIIEELSNEHFADFSSFIEMTNNIYDKINGLEKLIERNSYYDYFDANDNLIPVILYNKNKLITSLKHEMNSFVNSSQTTIENAESTHKNKIQEYLGKTGSAILYGSFVVPAIMSLLALESWDKLLFIVFCIPVISQISSLYFLYGLVFSYSELDKGEQILAWSIAIYLLVSIGYFLIARAKSKQEMGGEVGKQNRILKKAYSYLEKIKKVEI